ncbi:type II toxin-antitoxin system CcdA family antitoxin [Ciceribacter azotifigens]|uniref:type II toxin-antitoxin system CcdA family antitoxin n=1 Tax=Ciceribacter azotifigens TaxID=2069303 RepID=UPI003A863002
MSPDLTYKTSAAISPKHASVDEAKSLEPRLSHAGDACTRQAKVESIADRWRRENAKAIASSNVWADQEGLPLERYRQF